MKYYDDDLDLRDTDADEGELGEEPALDGGEEITEQYLRRQGVAWDDPNQDIE